MEVGDGNKKVKVITRAMKPLIFGMAFVLFFPRSVYHLLYRSAAMEVALFFFFLIIELNLTMHIRRT